MAQKKTANKKTESSAASKSTNKSTKAKTAAKKPVRENKRTIAKKKSFLRSEIRLILSLVIGGIMLLTDLGLLGSIGAFLLGIQKGLFGQGYMLFAIAIVAAAAVAMKFKDTYFVKLKTVCVFGILTVAVSVIHLIFGTDAHESAGFAVTELYKNASAGAPGGGLVGGTVSNLLKSLVGYAGAYLVLIALLVIFLVIITEKSFVSAAKFGASKTAEAVKSGAGKTVEAARHGSERYKQIHRENVIRRDAVREEKKLRKLESSFPGFDGTTGSAADHDGRNSGSSIFGGNGGMSMSQAYDLGAIRSEAAEAEVYAGYGRDIIGEAQNNAAEQDYKKPLFASRYNNTRNTEGVNFDTEIISGDFSMPSANKNSQPVNIREINYDSDEVPFEETEDDKYKSYAHILKSGELSIDTAKRAGFAVNIQNYMDDRGYDEADTVDEPEHIAAFRTVDDIAKGGKTGSYKLSVDSLREAYDREGATALRVRNFDHYNGDDTADAYTAVADADEAISFELHGNEHDKDEQTAYTGSKDNAAAEIYTDADTDTAENEGIEEETDGAAYSCMSSDGGNEPEAYYTTATGKQMKSPDSYEADKILKSKGVTEASELNNAEAESLDAYKAASSQGTYQSRKPVSGAKPTGNSSLKTGDSIAAAEMPVKPKPKPRPYVYPRVNLLEKGQRNAKGGNDALRANAAKLQKVLRDFGVGVTVTNVIVGPRVSRYELTPDAGVKVSRITALTGDIKLALAAREIRIEAPIPGKSAVGVEVPNEVSSTVKFRDILESEEFKNAKSRLCWGVGLDIGGNTVLSDITKMPHILVAGTTGSGKSVGINSLIMSVLYRATPQEVRMILVDPKQVEFTVYNGIPHLLTPVVTTAERALSALNWAVAEMNRRYKLFQESGTRNIKGYNEKIEKISAGLPEEQRPEKLPFILIIIDELSELMMHAKKDVESCIVSLAQLARAAGIHLVVATQRPSVDVVTGLIKSNIPSRVAFKLPSVTDSRTILDSGGAETLLGNGDMLYKPGDKSSPIRVQGAFLSDEEVENVVSFITKHNRADEDPEIETAIERQLELNFSGQQPAKSNEDDTDENFADAGRFIINTQRATIGALQRKYKLGFNRAARIMDQLCEAGVVSDGEGTKERHILMSIEQFEEYLGSR